jgi:hypothetical protein
MIGQSRSLAPRITSSGPKGSEFYATGQISKKVDGSQIIDNLLPSGFSTK